VTGEAAGREVRPRRQDCWHVSLIGVLVAGWRGHHDLTSAARRTCRPHGSTELVQLATHRVITTQRPSVTVLVDGDRVATLQLDLSLVFDVSALLAGISAGRLVALHSGRCDVTATLAIQGADVVTRQSQLELAGAIPLSLGIRLLSERITYPIRNRQQPGPAWVTRDGRQQPGIPPLSESPMPVRTQYGCPEIRNGPESAASRSIEPPDG
jgi:hypothetical protein